MGPRLLNWIWVVGGDDGGLADPSCETIERKVRPLEIVGSCVNQ